MKALVQKAYIRSVLCNNIICKYYNTGIGTWSQLTEVHMCLSLYKTLLDPAYNNTLQPVRHSYEHRIAYNYIILIQHTYIFML